MGDERAQKPISEIIDPLLPDGGMADAPAELRLFGFDSDLCIKEKKVSKVLKVRSPPTMLRIGLRKGREIFVTPNHRFFVLNEEGSFDIRRADELHVGDYIPTVTKLPKSPQRIRSVNLAIELGQLRGRKGRAGDAKEVDELCRSEGRAARKRAEGNARADVGSSIQQWSTQENSGISLWHGRLV